MNSEFLEFLESKGIDPDDERVPLLKEAWNKAIELASNQVAKYEGIDYGIEGAYYAW